VTSAALNRDRRHVAIFPVKDRTQTGADSNCAQQKVKVGILRSLVWILALALLIVPSAGAQTSQQGSGKDLSWAFPVADRVQPAEQDTGPRHLPGSSKSYTPTQIDDLFNPPDWFPEEHGPLPSIIAHGVPGMAQACGACHLMCGLGHPESANLAGLNAKYIAREMADFKSGVRRDAARMNQISPAVSEQDARIAAQWFAELRPKPWVKVIEADTVPKTYVNKTRMRLPFPGGGTEPIGNRIIELPEDPARATSRDPHSGFIAYVPRGSVAKGEALVKTGGSGKTIQCAICHGESLEGLGELPRIIGVSPLYAARQLYGFQTGTRNGSLDVLMKKVVANLNDDDIVAISAYLASRNF
jgi:cytochrome c553